MSAERINRLSLESLIKTILLKDFLIPNSILVKIAVCVMLIFF